MPPLRAILLGTVFGLAAWPAPAQVSPASSVPAVRLGTGVTPGDMLVLPDIDVVARRLDAARLSIQPSLGATRTDFSRTAIETLPQGDNANLNNVKSSDRVARWTITGPRATPYPRTQSQAGSRC